MRNNISHEFLHLILLLSLLWLKITSATPHGNRVLCIDKERHALLHFKANVNLDRNGLLSTWTHGQEATNDCCHWNGVTCNNQTGHVTRLELRLGLTGKISPSLMNLSYLNHLDLSDNEFYGNLPSSIGSLTELRYLNLHHTLLHGTIPTSISSLTELRYLDLSMNYFNGSNSVFNGSMTQLRYLDLSYNSFQGTVTTFIGYMTQLRHLGLSHNSFNGIIPSIIGSMTQLKHLDLSDNSFNGIIPSIIGSMTQLRHLDLSDNSFNGAIPQEFGNITNLRALSLGNLGGCTIKNLDWLSRLSHLWKLDMSGISIAKENYWVNVMLGLHKLSDLRLRGCGLSNVTRPYYPPVKSSSSSINYLDLGNNHLNSSMYHWLFKITSNRLEYLDISGNTLDGIPSCLGNLCSLTHLYISNNLVTIKFPDFLKNLSGCTSYTLQELLASSSQFIGSLSNDIQKFVSLETLYLSNNQLNGTISEKVWELPKLEHLDISSNSLKGVISGNIGNSKLLTLDLSNNSLEGVPSDAHVSNLSYIQFINLRSCKLGPGFPKWIQKLKNLSSLDISNTSISDTIPQDFWNMWSSQFMDIDLSLNNITGKVINLSSNFDYEVIRINLSSNNFYGPLRNVPSALTSLDLSKNKFNGEISFVCQILDGYLSFLDLSHNSFTGKIPNCLWHFTWLTVLNLRENNLFGRLPPSIGYLINLEVLYLYNNNFSGELPLSLQNCTKLTFLELKGNNFSGDVPVWIGEKLSRLYILSLASNNFFGNIPLQLCQLVNLQILDLSINNLYGTIPPCLGNLTAMVQDRFLPHPNVHHLSYNVSADGFVDHAMINWQGIVREFRNTLGLVKSIDLSSNNLTGSIPYELANLHELIALNLSMNALHGEIPPKIGLMKKLLQLDLSRNNLSGRIPTSMSQMTLLDYLDVSFNNLSGRIPSSTQLQSFEPSKYTGNELCGPPLTKYCPGDKGLEIPLVVGHNKGGNEGMDELERWYYIGGATGFATGFWIVCGALLVNRRVRNAFFHLFDSLKDWVYVKVMVFIAKWH